MAVLRRAAAANQPSTVHPYSASECLAIVFAGHSLSVMAIIQLEVVTKEFPEGHVKNPTTSTPLTSPEA